MTVTPKDGVRLARHSRSARVLLGAAWRTDPVRTIIVFFLEIMSAASDVAFAIWVKLLVDAAVSRDLGQALFVAAGVATTVGISVLAGIGGFILRLNLQEKVGLRIDERIIELTAGLPGIEHHERPEYLDEMQLLREQREELANALGAVVQTISFAVRIGVTVALLGRLHPFLLLLPMFGLPSLFTGARAQKLLITAEESNAERRRLSQHIFELTTTAAPAKELRVFGLREPLLKTHTELLVENDAVAWRARWQGALWSCLGWGIFAVGYAVGIAFVVHRAATGRASVGDVFLAMTLAAQVNAQVTGSVQMVTWLTNTLKTVGRYIWLEDYAVANPSTVADPAPIPARITRGIDMTGLAFTYPGTETEVLRDVNLHIPPGATVAIVGDNGAGKSTLVKLLCRFYQPTAGQITLDGVDIARFDHDAWRARLSAGFQDFAHFERYAGAARDVARTTGAITVLVSHRFSTVRMADLILVVDGGLIKEAGSHEDLMRARGLYAELYELQARAYR